MVPDQGDTRLDFLKKAGIASIVGGAAFSPSVVMSADAPSDDWNTLWTPTKVSDWDKALCKYANGVAQNDTYGDWTGTIDDKPDGVIRLAATGPITKRTRTELTSWTVGKGGANIPSNMLYEWEVFIPSHSIVSGMTMGGNQVTINQFHADQHCYGGGVNLDPATEIIRQRIKGGTTLSSDGSCKHAYDNSLAFGQFVRDEWFPVRIEVRWSTVADGYVLASVLDRSCAAVHSVPTQGAAGAGQVAAKKVMFRLGWYPPIVPAGGLEMLVRNVKVSTR